MIKHTRIQYHGYDQSFDEILSGKQHCYIGNKILIKSFGL